MAQIVGAINGMGKACKVWIPQSYLVTYLYIMKQIAWRFSPALLLVWLA